MVILVQAMHMICEVMLAYQTAHGSSIGSDVFQNGRDWCGVCATMATGHHARELRDQRETRECFNRSIEKEGRVADQETWNLLWLLECLPKRHADPN